MKKFPLTLFIYFLSTAAFAAQCPAASELQATGHGITAGEWHSTCIMQEPPLVSDPVVDVRLPAFYFAGATADKDGKVVDCRYLAEKGHHLIPQSRRHLHPKHALRLINSNQSFMISKENENWVKHTPSGYGCHQADPGACGFSETN